MKRGEIMEDLPELATLVVQEKLGKLFEVPIPDPQAQRYGLFWNRARFEKHITIKCIFQI